MCSDRVVTIRSPARQVDRPDGDVQAPVAECVRAIEPRPATDRRDRGARLVHPLEELLVVSSVRPADPELAVGDLGHRLVGLGRQRPDRCRR